MALADAPAREAAMVPSVVISRAVSLKPPVVAVGPAWAVAAVDSVAANAAVVADEDEIRWAKGDGSIA